MDKNVSIAGLIGIANISIPYINGNDDMESCMLDVCRRQLSELNKIYVTHEDTHINGSTLCSLMIDSITHLDTDKTTLSISHKTIAITTLSLIRNTINYHN